MTKHGWWQVDWDLTIEGETVRWNDLDECIQEHILQCIQEGFNSGEICMETDDDEEKGGDD